MVKVTQLHHHKHGWVAFSPRNETLSGWDLNFAAQGNVANTWFEYDLSGIVPESTVAVIIQGYIRDGVTNAKVSLSHPDYQNDYNACTYRTVVANVLQECLWIVGVKDQKIAFNCDPKAGDFTNIDVCFVRVPIRVFVSHHGFTVVITHFKPFSPFYSDRICVGNASE